MPLPFDEDDDGVTGRASLFTVEEVVEKQMAPPLKNKRSWRGKLYLVNRHLVPKKYLEWSQEAKYILCIKRISLRGYSASLRLFVKLICYNIDRPSEQGNVDSPDLWEYKQRRGFSRRKSGTKPLRADFPRENVNAVKKIGLPAGGTREGY